MSPTLREFVHGHASGSSVTVTTGAGTAIDDWLYCWHGSDFYAATGMVAPTGSAGTWNQQGSTVDIGTNNSHMKLWARKVTSGGANTITCAPITDEEVFNGVAVVSGADTSTPTDDVQGGVIDPGASTATNATAVSPTSSDALAISVILTELFKLANYTVAGGWTKQYEDDDSSTSAAAVKTLSASGSTGTVPWTNDITGCKVVAITVAIKAAGAAAAYVRPTIVVPRAAVQRAAGW